MESLLSSDDSSDQDLKCLKNQLSEYGLDEDNLSKHEMIDLLKALKNSKATNELEEQSVNKTVEDDMDTSSPKVTMQRRYLNVGDRRMPWSLFPQALSQSEKARVLAVYIKLMSINNYRQARQSVNMAAWPPPIQIIESNRIQPLRSTRSGRFVPVYTDYDEDSSDFECVVTKTRKRKVSNGEQSDISPKKSFSLKRKQLKDDNKKPVKEAKVRSEIQKFEVECSNTEIYSIIED